MSVQLWYLYASGALIELAAGIGSGHMQCVLHATGPVVACFYDDLGALRITPSIQ